MVSEIFACLVLLASSANGSPRQETVARHEPGRAPPGEVCEWTSPQGKPFWYRVPEKIVPSRPPNLLFMLHGTGLKWGWAFWNYPIGNGGFRKNDIVVAPEGMTPGGDTFNFIQGKEDGDQIVALTDLFRKRYPIGNVYLYGHSQGAFFCYWFAGEHAELIQGIVAHAGNVLANVKFPRYAKDNVAIGILHGKADAVVPVECADQTESVYREQGYKKLRKYLVDGLTEQSGHWPLPVQVLEMLQWLDSVSAQTAQAAVEALLAQLERESIDLGAVVDGVQRAQALQKKSKADTEPDVAARIAALEQWLKEVETAVLDLLVKEKGEQTLSKPGFGTYTVLVRLAALHLQASPSARAALKEEFKAAEAHDKKVQAFLKSFVPSKKSLLSDAREVIEKNYLALAYEELRERTLLLAGSQPGEDAEQLERLIEERRSVEEDAQARLKALLRGKADAFRELHPEWKLPES